MTALLLMETRALGICLALSGSRVPFPPSAFRLLPSSVIGQRMGTPLRRVLAEARGSFRPRAGLRLAGLSSQSSALGRQFSGGFSRSGRPRLTPWAPQPLRSCEETAAATEITPFPCGASLDPRPSARIFSQLLTAYGWRQAWLDKAGRAEHC